MATEADILRAASLLVQEYGDMAPNGAKIRADHLEAKGDKVGKLVWLRVAKAAERMLAEDRPDSAVLP